MKYKKELVVFLKLSVVSSLAISTNIISIKNVSAQQAWFTRIARLQTQFTGRNKCLDIINDGINDRQIMADCGNYSGQFWSVEPTQNQGFYRLKTQFTGRNKCLDIINDGMNDRLAMTNCGNYSGQFWHVEPTQNQGSYRLKTQFTGRNKCLDIINDGANNQPIMADCGNYSGQFWNLF